MTFAPVPHFFFGIAADAAVKSLGLRPAVVGTAWGRHRVGTVT